MSMMDTLQNTLHETMIFKSKARGENTTDFHMLQLHENAIKATLTAISKAEVIGKSRKSLTDEEIITVMRKQVKERKEAAELYIGAGEPQRASDEIVEASFLEKFLPATLSEDDARKFISQTIEENKLQEQGKRAIGTVMKTIKSQNVQIDNSLASRLTMEILNIS